MNRIFPLIIVLILIAACGSSSNSTKVKDPHKDMHDKVHQNYINEQRLKFQKEQMAELQGTYQGKIPCADCEHIVYKITLSQSGSFLLSRTYQGQSPTPVVTDGDYTVNDDGTIELQDDDNAMNRLKPVDNGLVLLAKNGQEVKGDLASSYLLKPVAELSEKKTQAIGLQKVLLKLQQKGIEFYAVGNEPFWKLEMDLDKRFKFSPMDGQEFSIPPVEPEHAQDGDVLRYRGTTELGEMIIQLSHSPCSDNMSGESFPYQVEIQIKRGTNKDFQVFKGCGLFIPDFRMHNIWAIQSVNGKQINPADFKRKVPVFEFNLTDNKLIGNNGCNNINGPVEVQHDKIFFGNYITTMMACPDVQELSSEIMSVLQSKHVEYNIEQGILTLSKNNKPLMTLKAVD